MALKTIDNPGVDHQSHKVKVSGLCPVTNNPLPSSFVIISYTPISKLLEIYSLSEYINSFKNNQETRDLEAMVKKIADDCAGLLETPVTVLGKFELNVNQTVTTKTTSRANLLR